MSVYHQLGYQSANLIEEPEFIKYQGAIISPAHYSYNDVVEYILSRKFPHDKFELIFDPQLYYPRTEKGVINSWKYFPTTYETNDSGSDSWWIARIKGLLDISKQLGINNICTPINIPKVYDSTYFLRNNKIARHALDIFGKEDALLQTIIIPLNYLTNDDFIGRVTSILSMSEIKRNYVIFIKDNDPRREWEEQNELLGAMKFIRIMQQNGHRLLIGYTSSNIILWKTALAADCATGKHLSLRCFTPKGWSPKTSDGGGQLPYMFEENFIGYFRESDVLRLNQLNLLSAISKSNPFFSPIMQQIVTGSKWLGLSWRFFLYWFSDFEYRFNNGQVDTVQLLVEAKKNWEKIKKMGLHLEEEKLNDGSWIENWISAINKID